MRLADPQATHALGLQLAQLVRPGDVIALSGDLGAGKTSLARGLLAGLGWQGDVASPTFPLVIPYDPPQVRLPLWHVDLYRIDDSSEIDALALDDALLDGALVIEWPERLENRLWPQTLWLRLEADGEGRRLTARVPEAWGARWPIP